MPQMFFLVVLLITTCYYSLTGPLQLQGSDKRARLLAANSVLKAYVDIAQVINP